MLQNYKSPHNKLCSVFARRCFALEVEQICFSRLFVRLSACVCSVSTTPPPPLGSESPVRVSSQSSSRPAARHTESDNVPGIRRANLATANRPADPQPRRVVQQTRPLCVEKSTICRREPDVLRTTFMLLGPREAPPSSWRASGLRPLARLSRDLKGRAFWAVKQKEERQQQQQLKDLQPQGRKLTEFPVFPLDD